MVVEMSLVGVEGVSFLDSVCVDIKFGVILWFRILGNWGVGGGVFVKCV